MKTTKYLYDIEPKELIGMEYKKAIEFKIAKGKELFDEIYDGTYTLPIGHPRLMRASEVMKAIHFNEQLLKELAD